MGIEVNIPFAGYTGAFSKFVIPEHLRAEGIWWLGGDLERSKRNGVRSRGWGDAVIVGEPIAHPTYCSVRGQINYFQCPFGGFPEMTLAVVARSTGDNLATSTSPTFLGTDAGSEQDSFTIHVLSATSVRMEIAIDTGSGPALTASTLIAASPASWACYIADGGAAGRAIYDMTNGTQDVDPHTATRPASSTPVAIGGNNGADRYGPADIMFAGVFSKRLNAAERAYVYGLCKSWAISNGIVI